MWSRPAGEPGQEVGEIELTRIWTKAEQIRAKQVRKAAEIGKASPLPITSSRAGDA